VSLSAFPLALVRLALALSAVAIIFNLWAWTRHRSQGLAWYAFLGRGVSLRGVAWLTPAGRPIRQWAERAAVGSAVSLGLAVIARLLKLLVR
jgi:hypothetical protein